MSIRLVEPDLKDPLKARHVFECQECGLSRAYLMIANQSTRKAPQERSSSLSARLSRSAGLQAPLWCPDQDPRYSGTDGNARF